MIEHEGFLQTIIADPEDDATRLIYADWLEEQGDTDRAAFIDGKKILRRILAAPAVKAYCVDEVYPGAKVASDEDVLDFCRKTGSTMVDAVLQAMTARSGWCASISSPMRPTTRLLSAVSLSAP